MNQIKPHVLTGLVLAVLSLAPLQAEVVPKLRELAGVWRTDFNADGTRMIVQTRQGELEIWDTTTGEIIAGDLGKMSSEGTYAVDPSRRRTLVGFKEGGTRVFDLKDGRAVSPMMDLKLEGDFGPPVVFNPDGSHFLVIRSSGQCQFFDAVSGKMTAHLDLPPFTEGTERMMSAMFGKDGKQVLILDAKGVMHFCDAGTLEESGAKMQHPFSEEYAIAFDWDGVGHYALTIDSAGELGPPGHLQIWDLSTSKAVGAPIKGNNGISASFLAGGKRLLITPARGTSRVMAIPSMENVYDLRAHDDLDASRGMPSPNGESLICWGHDKVIERMDAKTGKVEAVFINNAKIQQVVMGGDSTSVWLGMDNSAFSTSGLHDTYLARLDLKTMHLAKIVRFDHYLNPFALSPDGSKLAVSLGESDRERLHLLDAISLEELPATAEGK